MRRPLRPQNSGARNVHRRETKSETERSEHEHGYVRATDMRQLHRYPLMDTARLRTFPLWATFLRAEHWVSTVYFGHAYTNS